MDWYIVISIVAIVTIAFVWNRLWRKQQTRKLPWIKDDEFCRLGPEFIQPNVWIKTRREVASMLRIDPERLDPTMPLTSLGAHFTQFGISSIDLDGVYEICFSGESEETLKALSTVGDLLVLYTSSKC